MLSEASEATVSSDHVDHVHIAHHVHDGCLERIPDICGDSNWSLSLRFKSGQSVSHMLDRERGYDRKNSQACTSWSRGLCGREQSGWNTCGHTQTPRLDRSIKNLDVSDGVDPEVLRKICHKIERPSFSWAQGLSQRTWTWYASYLPDYFQDVGSLRNMWMATNDRSTA